MLSGGKDAGKTAGIVFAATMIVRIPVFVFTGLAASLLPNLTRLNPSGKTAEFHRMLVRATGLFAAVAAMIVVFGATIGPQTLLAIYGPSFKTTHLDLALLGVAAGGYLAAATLAQALLALASGRTAAAIWCTSAAIFVVGLRRRRRNPDVPGRTVHGGGDRVRRTRFHHRPHAAEGGLTCAHR